MVRVCVYVHSVYLRRCRWLVNVFLLFAPFVEVISFFTRTFVNKPHSHQEAFRISAEAAVLRLGILKSKAQFVGVYIADGGLFCRWKTHPRDVGAFTTSVFHSVFRLHDLLVELIDHYTHLGRCVQELVPN
jgi:hypothetical protein